MDRQQLESEVRRLERVHHEMGWDQPPRLYILLDDHTVNLPVFEMAAARRFERPPDFLAVFAEWLRGRPEDPLPVHEPARGWAYVDEGWMLTAADPEEEETAMRQAAEHQLHRHPNRIEVRMAVGVTKTDRLMVVRVRGGEPHVNHGASGYVMDSLRRLAEVLPEG